MASIERRSGRYRVKYRDPTGRQRSRTTPRARRPRSPSTQRWIIDDRPDPAHADRRPRRIADDLRRSRLEVEHATLYDLRDAVTDSTDLERLAVVRGELGRRRSISRCLCSADCLGLLLRRGHQPCVHRWQYAVNLNGRGAPITQ
jgi:hypothetical protein